MRTFRICRLCHASFVLTYIVAWTKICSRTATPVVIDILGLVVRRRHLAGRCTRTGNLEISWWALEMQVVPLLTNL